MTIDHQRSEIDHLREELHALRRTLEAQPGEVRFHYAFPKSITRNIVETHTFVDSSASDEPEQEPPQSPSFASREADGGSYTMSPPYGSVTGSEQWHDTVVDRRRRSRSPISDGGRCCCNDYMRSSRRPIERRNAFSD